MEVATLIAGQELGALAGVEVYYRPRTQDELVYDEVCRANEYRLPDCFKVSDVIVDVGAHIGCFALACIGRGAYGLRCYEPAKDNFVLLAANLFGRVYAPQRNQAVWVSGRDQPDVLSLKRPESPVGTAMCQTRKADGDEKVEAVGLDSILLGLPPVRLLKLDCEGAEYPILTTSTLLRRCQEIVGELHHGSETVDKCRGMITVALTNAGFTTVIEPHPRCPDILSHFWSTRK